MSAITQYWQEREPREKTLLTIMSVLFLLIIGWFFIIAPVFATQEKAQNALNTAQRDYITVSRLAPILSNAAAVSGPAFNQGTLISAAQRRGINPSRLQPDGNGNLTVWIETGDAQALYGLLNDVITRNGASLSRASISTNADQTLSAQLTFKLSS